MVAATLTLENFQVNKLHDRLFIPVPWEQADDLRNRLEAGGIPATAFFDPAERTAGLEVAPDADVENIKKILNAPQG